MTSRLARHSRPIGRGNGSNEMVGVYVRSSFKVVPKNLAHASWTLLCNTASNRRLEEAKVIILSLLTASASSSVNARAFATRDTATTRSTPAFAWESPGRRSANRHQYLR